MILVGVVLCLPFILFARRFGHFGLVIFVFLMVVGLLEVGYANVFSYYYGEIIQMNNNLFIRFALGGFALIVGFAIDIISIVIMGANDESRTDAKEGFLDKMERIREDDARRENIVYDGDTPRWESIKRNR